VFPEEAFGKEPLKGLSQFIEIFNQRSYSHSTIHFTIDQASLTRMSAVTKGEKEKEGRHNGTNGRTT